MTVVFETPKDAYYFFGYFDKSPFDGSDARVLAQRVTFMDRMPGPGDIAEIGYFDWKGSGRFIKIAESRSWNWQTGCMAQWLGPDYGKEIVYNDLVEGVPGTIRLNLETGKKFCHEVPVGAVDARGRYGLSVDYGRMRELRHGYGYALPDPDESSRSGRARGSGILRADMKDGAWETIVDLERLRNNQAIPSMATPHHMLDNPVFNPSGDRVAFFHRWKIPDGAFHTRLYVVDTDGGNLSLLHDTGRVSHINWRNDREIVAFLGWETRINRLRKNPGLTKYVLKPLVPVYHLLVGHHWQVSRKIRGDTYGLIDVESGEARKLDAEELDRDGHPSFAPHREEWMLTDTYPDWKQRARLLLYSMSRNDVHEVDMVHSVRKYDESELRCDLHPRWSRDGTCICIDHMENGHRGMRIYDASSIVGASSRQYPKSAATKNRAASDHRK